MENLVIFLYYEYNLIIEYYKALMVALDGVYQTSLIENLNKKSTLFNIITKYTSILNEKIKIFKVYEQGKLSVSEEDLESLKKHLLKFHNMMKKYLQTVTDIVSSKNSDEQARIEKETIERFEYAELLVEPLIKLIDIKK